MKRHLHALLALWTSLTLAMTGCAPTQPFFFFEDGDLSHYVGMATNIEHPDVETASLAEVERAGQPMTVSDPKFNEIWELSLQDAVRYALENSKVMRSLGGRQASFGGQRPQQDESPETVLRAPQQITTVYDPAIVESDPNLGVEGALSAFDVQLGSALFWEKNDRPQNIENRRFVDANGDDIPDDRNGDGVIDSQDKVLDNSIQQLGFSKIRRQDLGQFNTTLSKRLATGGRVAVAANSTYEYNNSQIRELPSDWTQNFEVQWSQPLLQGGGLFFNRIAGPVDPFNGSGTPNFDGVLLARIRTDISLADFEGGIRNLVNDVEGAYWNLYFAYRNLDARKVGRDSALGTWRKVYALYSEGSKGGEADKEAQAREQFYFFQGEVHTAYSDLLRAESRLRYIMGLAATDGRLVAPVTEPTIARVEFDWNEIHSEALVKNVELRQQRWRIKQAELELMAAKNLLLPRLDIETRYRWLGLGDDLINSSGRGFTGSNIDTLADTDAFSGITDGHFQESQIGLRFNMPLGFRKELATVRNQQLQLARARSVLQDQELELSHQLSEAVRLLDTSYVLLQDNFNRVVAAQRQVQAVEDAYRAGTVTFELVLDAQRRLSDALSSAYRAQADYNRNIAQVHFRKGSLLEYNDVYLAEGPWPGKAYFDAHRLARARDAAYFLDYGFTRPDVISRGPENTHGDGMTHGAPIEDGVIWHDRAPVEGVPTPATPMPAGPTDIAPEDLPSPGPAAMMRAHPSGDATSASHTTTEAPALPSVLRISGKRQGAFDWKIDRADQRSHENPVRKASAISTDEDRGVTKIKLTVGAEPVTSARDSHVRMAVAEEPVVTSGWKKAKK